MSASEFFRQRTPATKPLALRPREAATSLGVSVKTLERLTKSNEITSVLVGRVRLYEVSALESFLERRRVIGQEVTS
jgi:excisionase family DNA binding protein